MRNYHKNILNEIQMRFISFANHPNILTVQALDPATVNRSHGTLDRSRSKGYYVIRVQRTFRVVSRARVQFAEVRHSDTFEPRLVGTRILAFLLREPGQLFIRID